MWVQGGSEFVEGVRRLGRAGGIVMDRPDWKNGDKVLVAFRGAVFGAVVKVRHKKDCAVRLDYDDSWIEVDDNRIFPPSDADSAAVAAGLKKAGGSK